MAETLVLKIDYDIAAAEAKQEKLNRDFEVQKRKIAATKKEIDGLNDRLETEFKKHKKINEEINKQQGYVDKAAKSGSAFQLDKEKERLAELRAEREKIYAAEEKITTAIERRKTVLSGEQAQEKNIGDQIKLQQQKTDNLKQKKEEVVSKSKEEGSTQKNATIETEKSSGALDKFTKRIGNLAKRVFVFSMITKALRALRSAIGEKIAADPAMAKILATIKGNLAVIGQMFYTTIRPALEWALTALNKITQVFAYFLQQMTGVTVKSAAQQLAAQQTAAAAKKTAKSTKETAKNTEKATAGFDTLQKIETKTDDVSTAADESSGIQPDYSQFTGAAAMTEQELITLEGIIGGALMAVGLLLITFGQLPVGIGMLVVGALMAYQAITAAYGRASTDVKNLIVEIMAVAGTALMALGLILISYGQLPIGIACLAVGIASLVAATALSVGSASEDVQKALMGVMALVGGAMIAIGLILLLGGTPDKKGLGIACLAIGVAMIIAMAVISIFSASDDVKLLVLAITALVGTAMIAIGMILLLSPASTALGIACLAIGVALIVAAVVISYTAMSDEMRSTLSEWMAIVGSALLAIGVLLCVTGGGIPLGIALIVAGAASLVGSIALNWNAILDKIKEIAGKIGTVFKNLWEGIKKGFKAMVNGIISFANAWIDGLNLLLIPIRGLIYGIAKVFGSDISWDQVAIPHIPALATGAVIPGGSPFLAQLGDQPAGKTNIEAPEDLIRQIVREESGGKNFTITATGSMAQLIRLLRLEIKREDERASIYTGG